MENAEKHLIKCSDCGAEDTVGFKPKGEKPVYCAACHQKRWKRV